MSLDSPQRPGAGVGGDDDATVRAWDRFADDPDNLEAKAALWRSLRDRSEALTAERAPLFLRLITDRQVEPDPIAQIGWHFLLDRADLFTTQQAESCAKRLEEDLTVRTLLAEAPVALYAAERQLTQARRWLLMSGTWQNHPQLVTALRLQTALNEGAWLIDDDEMAALRAGADDAIVSLYFPEGRDGSARADLADPVTRAVAEQYESWPYPRWTRATLSPPQSLAAKIRMLDPSGPDTIPANPDILVAGCGSGRQAAYLGLNAPEARITAIDVSEASLRYARSRCGALGLTQIEFLKLDLHRLADLGRRFDAVYCSGVLHHLPDPESGWAVLVDVLKPGGVLHIHVYSTLARLRVRGYRPAIADLLSLPRDSATLRQIRRRIIERFPERVPLSRDFYTLSGVHDLLAHRHEDPFDVARIRRAIERFGLRFIRFHIKDPVARARYRREFPDDPDFCDFASWSAFERRNPGTFATMYDFWCRKP